MPGTSAAPWVIATSAVGPFPQRQPAVPDRRPISIIFVPGERSFTLRRAARIQRTGEFAAIRQRGKRIVRGCLIANWVRLAPEAGSKVGVITSRKVGIAVERSRARRLLREAFRLHQHELREPVALVLVARASIQGKTRQVVEQDLLAALRAGGCLTPPAATPASPLA